MTPLFVPAAPATEQFPAFDGTAAALEALLLAADIPAAAGAAFAAHDLDVRAAR